MNQVYRILSNRILVIYHQHRNYRFIPEKPVWRWHDDRSPCTDSTIFFIPPEEVPPRTELDDLTVRLLERLSLINFDSEKTKGVLEEAIHFANCLLTPTAFRGISKESVAPMYSLLEDLEVAMDLREDEPLEECQTANHILRHASLTWENYFVAPPGNQPIHPELSTQSHLGKRHD
ncbi:unnamed protein product [Mesocestoides corti]|uniref:Glutamyl-tRNA(Gln) amidotransferase subunit C, mitochondrial n=1 Tax=Mesocestoides corti TaxID=53468 RepID=A0A0R3U8R9_MESCO|nr:unnamed protein product [Mesocestoides corti]